MSDVGFIWRSNWELKEKGVVGVASSASSS